MKLQGRAIAALTVGVTLGTAACWQVADLTGYEYDASAPVGPNDSSVLEDAGDAGAVDAAPVADASTECANNACNISCSGGFSLTPSGLVCGSAGFFVENPACADAGAGCTLYPQCGCGPDSTCQRSDNGPTCVAAGTFAVNEPCIDGEPGQCQTGLTCIDSVCVSTCTPQAGGCAPGNSCTPVPGNEGYVCLPTCNALDTSTECLNPATNCSIASDFPGIAACVTAGLGGPDAGCNVVPTTCARGLVCVGSGSSAACRSPVALDADCGAGVPATPFSTAYDAGFGYCRF